MTDPLTDTTLSALAEEAEVPDEPYDCGSTLLEGDEDVGDIPRIVYQVLKFIPATCPKCDRAFRDPQQDFSLLLGRIKDGQKVPRFHSLYDVIVCECGNATARLVLEEARVFNRPDAERLLSEEGFTSITVGEAFGTDAERPSRHRHLLELEGFTSSSVDNEFGSSVGHVTRHRHLLGVAVHEHPELVSRRLSGNDSTEEQG